MTTYRDIIRAYSTNVASGHSDSDLTPRQRRIVHVLLNLSQNAPLSNVVYPPTDQTRTDVCRFVGDIIWYARPLVGAYASSAFDAPDFDLAVDRASAILRNV